MLFFLMIFILLIILIFTPIYLYILVKGIKYKFIFFLFFIEFCFLFYIYIGEVIFPPRGGGITNSIQEAKRMTVFNQEFYIPGDKIVIKQRCTLNVKEVWTEAHWTLQNYHNLHLRGLFSAGEIKNVRGRDFNTESFCIKINEPICDVINNFIPTNNILFSFGRVFSEDLGKGPKNKYEILFHYINDYLLCSEKDVQLTDTTVIYIYPGDLYFGEYHKPIPPPIDSFLIIKKK
jgi:hypothetical protein